MNRIAERGSRNAVRAILFVLVHGIVLLGAATSFALEPSLRLADVRVGFDGRYQLGCWTRVAAIIENGNDRVTGVVQFVTADGDGAPVRYTSMPVTLEPHESQVVPVYVRFGRADATATLTLHSGDVDLFVERLSLAPSSGIALPAPLRPADRLIVCIGSMAALDDATAAVTIENGRIVVVALDDPAWLPDHWLGYEGVDAVVLAPTAAKSAEAALMQPVHRAALRRWLELGGRVWSAPSDAATAASFAAGESSPPFWFGDAGPDAPLPRTTALEKLAGAETLASIAVADLRRRPMVVPRIVATDAVVEAAEGDLPLLVRGARGFGTLVVTAFHPDHPLLASWPGQPGVVRRVLVALGTIGADEAAAAASATSAARTDAEQSTANFGYDDLAGQLRASLDHYAGVEPISFFTLALLLIGFVVVAGPLDYWFVHRVLKRPEWTWMTYPVLAVVVSAAAYGMAVRAKGDALRVTRADVIDCDADGGLIRTTSFAGVFSPASRAYDAAFQSPGELGATTDRETETGWFGLPGSGLGGMHARGLAAAESSPYEATIGADGLRNVPIDVWSSKMFSGTSTQWRTESMHDALTEDFDGRVRGTLRNPFPWELREAVLCYGTRAYEVGALAAGASRDLRALNVRDLQSVLQGWHVVMSANKNPLHVGLPHDPGSRDTAEILRKMMFYSAAGGRDYAALRNDFQNRLDLSALVKMRRAVLVGRIDPAGGGDLRISASGKPIDSTDGETRVGFVRLVIPVVPTP